MANKCRGGRGWSLAVLLCGAGGVASFCFGGWRPSGLETLGVSPSFRCGVGDYSGYYLYGAAAHYGGSDPSGVGLQGRPSLCTPSFGWDDGHLERPRSLGSSTYFEYYKWIYGKLYNRELWREEGEVQQHLGAGDDTEFMLDEKLEKATFYTQFVQVMGDLPPDLEDPTLEQLGAMTKKVKAMKQPPYADFAVWLPYAKKHLKAQKYKSFVMQADGSFVSKLVPGPACFQHWLLSYRVLRTTLVMMDQVGLANLMQWENKIEALNNRYENCWHLIAEADDKGRGEQMAKTFSKILVDCKIWHVEEGHPWSELLDRTFKKCKRGLERGKGPRKRAPEVPSDTRGTAREERGNNKKATIRFARELFEFGMCWMLREAELAILSTTHVRIDHILKRVRLRIPVSKKDQEGEGVQRVLQCLCGEGRCKPECPYEVAQDLLDKLQRRSAGASKLCVAKQGKLATKARLVASWRTIFQQPVSGHSARRTGALEYIRAGWSVGQVSHLGRWKSNVILQYAEEALASMPANLVQHGVQAGQLGNAESAKVVETTRLEEWKEALMEEVNLLKVKVKDATKEDKEKKELWKKLSKETQGRLPQKVQSRRQQVVHLNLARSVASPPIGWRTACGWHFYGNNFVFVENDCEVTCDKCKGFCEEPQRGGECRT